MEIIIHYFSNNGKAYTPCWRLPTWVKHTSEWSKVTCLACLTKLSALTPAEVNGRLKDCSGIEEALDLLGALGHVRAAEIYGEA